MGRRVGRLADARGVHNGRPSNRGCITAFAERGKVAEFARNQRNRMSDRTLASSATAEQKRLCMLRQACGQQERDQACLVVYGELPVHPFAVRIDRPGLDAQLGCDRTRLETCADSPRDLNLPPTQAQVLLDLPPIKLVQVHGKAPRKCVSHYH